MLDKLLKMETSLQTIKMQVAKYKILFAADGTIDAKEQTILDTMEKDVQAIEKRLGKIVGTLKNGKKLYEETLGVNLEDERKTATFHLLGYDIVKRINLLDASGEKILQTITLQKGYVFTGRFVIGEGQPEGNYIVQILGTHIPIVRGMAWHEGTEPLNQKEYVVKINKDRGIDVLIDFKQEFAESPYYPKKQDNTEGKETSISLNPPFGIQTIQLMRTNSNTPVEVWDIEPSKFQGDVTVFLDDNKGYGQYPDDMYYFEVIGYNKGEIFKSLEIDKIDELTLNLKWRVEAPLIKVALTIDFDPRKIYFINEDNEKKSVDISGERLNLKDILFVTNNYLTVALAPGNYKIEIYGISEYQKDKTVVFPTIYTKKNLYSKFEVLIDISDKDLKDEVNIDQVISDLINYANAWWEGVVDEINKVIESRCKKSEEVKGLFGHLEGTVVGDTAKFLGGGIVDLAIMCEKYICLVVNNILKYGQENSWNLTVKDIVKNRDTFIKQSRGVYTVTKFKADPWFQSFYLEKHKDLTTGMLLLQIQKDIDMIVAGKSQSQVVRELISKK